jgi:hypothetical protein
MTSIVIAQFLKPIAALILFGLICLPARLLVQKFPEGKIKRILLFPVGAHDAAARHTWRQGLR